MVRRDLVRKTPGARPAGECSSTRCPGDADVPDASNASSDDTVCHNSSTFCAGRPAARSLPAGVFLAMAAAATGNGVCAFAPMSHPAERASFATRGRWPQLTASEKGPKELASSVGLASGLRRREGGRNDKDDGCGRGQKTWLASAGREQASPEPNPEATNPPVSGNPSPAGSLPASENRKQQWRREGGRLNSRRMTAEGRSGSEGGVFVGRAEGKKQGTVKNGKKKVAVLWELMEYRGGEGTEEEGPAPSTATNKTELSQKVEAELFQEYDAMVPGPASSSAITVEGVDGRGGVDEKKRTGRPLAVNLDLLSYRARQKAIKGDYAAAQKLYRDCVELDPRDGRGWLGLARQMQKKQKFDKAQRLFEVGLENCVDNPYLLQAFAVMEEQRGNQAKALTLLNRSVRVHPEHTASWVALGLLNERGERIDEARACFETATKNDPKNYYAWLVWGMLEKRFGSATEAREKFKTCLRVNPRNAKVYQAWGVLESEEENYELAAELFRAGLEQQPGNTFVMQGWAMMEARRGDRDGAIRLLKQALVERPEDGALWQTYALLLKEMGDIVGARALFRKGVEQAPKHSPTWQAWGMMEWQLGNVSAARKIFQEGVWETPRGPNVVRILQAWAILEASELNYNDARKYFGFALARDPYSIPVMVAWALMEESLGDISRARQLLEIATKTQPGNVEIWNVYEQVEYRGGFHTEAKAVHERRVTALKGVEDDARRSVGGGAWWDRTPSPSSPSSARGMPSLLDQASRSLGTSSAEMALRVSRIVGGVQWASDYMSFSALTGGLGGEIALEP